MGPITSTCILAAVARLFISLKKKDATQSGIISSKEDLSKTTHSSSIKESQLNQSKIVHVIK
jgi:hypothetical protein